MAAEVLYPGVYVEELATAGRSIEGVATSTAAFVDKFLEGPLHRAALVLGLADFARVFGDPEEGCAGRHVRQFFRNGGTAAYVVRVGGDRDAADAAAFAGARADGTGLFALDAVDLFNVLCLPSAADLAPAEMRSVYAAAAAYCEERRAFLLVDVPESARSLDAMRAWLAENETLRHRNAAVYFPRLRIGDRASSGRPRTAAASGTIAGLYARNDVTRGVWTAPAGAEAPLRGVQELAADLSDRESEALNALGVNCVRSLPTGPVAWGARTLEGVDGLASDWRYVQVRRLALFLEESIERGIRWAVFEPNDEPLWSQVRLRVEVFLQQLFAAGAFQGRTPQEAYFVRCGADTTTQDDIDAGRLNIEVGFAPLRPAEFVRIRIQQRAAYHPIP